MAAPTFRDVNVIRVVDLLRTEGVLSRNDLVRRSGLSRHTITMMVRDLQARGLVDDAPQNGDELPRGPGRPPAVLRLTPAAGVVLGIDFGHHHVRVGVADLSSCVIAERRAALDVDGASDVALDAAVALADELLAEAGLARGRVVGAGLGVPGPIDRATGTVGSSMILPGWAGAQPAAALSSRLRVPVALDNDANVGALGELSFGAGRGHDDLIYVKVSSGIGAGIVMGGRLQRGATGIAGELGHVRVSELGDVCRCGSRGCLETVASTGPLLASLRPIHPDITVQALVELARAGDPGAIRVVQDAGLAIGRALGALCNALNPAAIIVGGDLSRAGEPLLGGIRSAVDRHAQPAAARAVDIAAAALGERAEVLGTLRLVAADTACIRSEDLLTRV